jgi:tetratricopeptide (TPR) repeat protein/tRNA A-37 threonylcarbamoyl transferase component Bud32/TolB-like protein
MAEVFDRLKAALSDRYAIERELGAGGMATVYLAEDLKHERKVAVKVLRPELAASIGADRFLREIKIAANLNHPHILPLHDSGEADGFLFYVMPYVEGESLRDRLNRDKQFPIDDALKIASEVADALGFAHDHNVIHRDIKPENILLEARHAVVADFGVARAIEEAGETRLTETGIAIGTPAYLSPEQATGERELDGRSDIYALGCVLYEMLAGQAPFTGPTVESIVHQHLTVEPHSVAGVRPTVSNEVEAAVSKALAKAPADRFQTAEELVAAMSAVSGTTSSPTLPGVAPLWSHPAAVAGLFAVGAVTVLGMVYVLMILLGLPNWVLVAAAVLLVVMLPFVVGTGLVERHRVTRTVPTPYSGLGGAVHRWLRWRKAAQGTVLAFIGLGVVTTGYMGMRSLGVGPMGTVMARGVLEAQDRILVVDFENRTSDSTLGATLTDALRIDLGQSPVIRVLETRALRAALQRMGRGASETITLELAEELAEREGVKAIVAGEVGGLGEGYVLSGRLVEAATGEVLIAERATASSDQELIQAVDGLSAKLRERIGESLRTVRSTPPLAQVTTSSLEALRLFTEAHRVSYSREQSEALPYIEQAIAIDTTFASAYRTLVVFLRNLQLNAARRIELSRKAYTHRDRLTDRERDLVEVEYYTNVEPDPEQVIARFRRMLERNAADRTALNNLGFRLRNQRQWEETEELFRRARNLAALAGQYSFSMVGILQPQLTRNDWAALDSSLTVIEDVRPDLSYYWRSRMAAARRDYDTAWEDYERYVQHYPEESDGWSDLGRIARVRGQLALAEEHTQRFRAVVRGQDDYYMLVTETMSEARTEARYLGNTAYATSLLDSTLQLHLDSVPSTQRGPALLDAAHSYAVLGQFSAAAEYVAVYRTENPEEVRRLQPEWYHVSGWVALAAADFEQARRAFRAWYDEYGCASCGLYELAETFDGMGNTDSAIVAYERALTTPDVDKLLQEYDRLPLVYRRLGELYEQRGDRDNAVRYYNDFIELWKDADPVLQPQVEDVRQRIARLVGEPQR